MAPVVSYLLTCPNCGVREVTDFSYGGEVKVSRILVKVDEVTGEPIVA